ncbi:hypothetical protein [Teredinibacter turnerae]|uniref:hypothetical protein n=1 Tax=Teredinibacter turnerae TaxID=2426 RepID=UPI000362691C|nr:hypothetical protein [Teredinibacter turnerae]
MAEDNNNSIFFNLVREGVHKKWDPIGVSSYTEEMGEYDGYLPSLCKLLNDGASEEQVFDFLWTVETQSMGLSGDEQATRDFSKWLVDLSVVPQA